MKKIIITLLVLMAFASFADAQTITITSIPAAAVGEPFEYTITINGITNLNTIAYVEDNLGTDIDYLSIDMSPQMQYMANYNCSGGITPVPPTTPNIFKLMFSGCNGAIIGTGSLSFKIKAQFNLNTCGKSGITNTVVLHRTDLSTTSASVSVGLNITNPFKLIKTFRAFTNGELVYDIRVTSNTGNFYNLDWQNAQFTDAFTIPSCLDIDPVASHVVYIPNENTMAEVPVVSSPVVVGTDLNFTWGIPAATSNSSYLFLVKIKVNDCSCAPAAAPFPLKNQVQLEAYDKCGNAVGANKTFIIPKVKCNNHLPDPGPVDPDTLCVRKEVFLDNNNLNLTMKTCTGKYVITIKNCTQGFTIDNLNIKDIIPSELSINPPITVTGAAAISNLSGNVLEVLGNATMNPGDAVTITIPFTVNTSLPNRFIKNCTNVKADASDGTGTNPIIRQACDIGIVTVPNGVALHTTKSICNAPNHSCGGMSINGNLPGDIVEYTLHVYNFGTVKGKNVVITDPLPNYFKIQNLNSDVKVYKFPSGNVTTDCGMMNPTDEITNILKNVDPVTNKLKIDFQTNELDEFTCSGVVHYIIKVKVKIDNAVVSGTYNNQFVVNYRNAGTNILATQVSNQVSSVVSLDNLIVSGKTVVSDSQDCANKTRTIVYKISLTNLSNLAVNADVKDIISVPAGLSIISISDFRKCSYVYPSVCTPATIATPPLTANGFNMTAVTLNPCANTIITFKVVYNTNLIPKGTTVQVCNKAVVKVYLADGTTLPHTPSYIMVTSDVNLATKYINAGTSVEKLNILQAIKAQKLHILDKENTLRTPAAYDKLLSEALLNSNIDLGVDTTLPACTDIADCMRGNTSGCFSEKSTSFGFNITGMNSNGIVTTTLALPAKRVTKIEYVLSDIRMIPTCKEGIVGYWHGIPIYSFCWACSQNLLGNFLTSPASATISTLSQPSILYPGGAYREKNRVQFAGPPTMLSNVSQSFQLPVTNFNCNGTYEFVITAVVYFEDCSVCYVSDTYDYNASHHFVFPGGLMHY